MKYTGKADVKIPRFEWDADTVYLLIIFQTKLMANWWTDKQIGVSQTQPRLNIGMQINLILLLLLLFLPSVVKVPEG